MAERYKPYFSEQNKVEGTTSTLALLEETIRIKNLLKEEEDGTQNNQEETIQTDVPEVPDVAPELMSSEENPQDVAEEGIQELLVSIIQKYGMENPIIDKLLTMGRDLKNDSGSDEGDLSDDLSDELSGDESSEGEGTEEGSDELGSDSEDQGQSLEDLLSSYGGGAEDSGEQPTEGAPEEGATPEIPTEEPPPPSEEVPEQTPEEKASEISDQEDAENKLRDEEEKPLDLADFSFKL